jgi:hypothetical protein
MLALLLLIFFRLCTLQLTGFSDDRNWAMWWILFALIDRAAWNNLLWDKLADIV